MKNSTLLALIIISTLFLAGCGSDDDDDPYAGIPTGDIVDLELRDAALIGSTSSGGRFAVGQKWWKVLNGEIRYNGTCDDETEDITPTNTYYGFYSSNLFYIKEGVNGDPQMVGSWQWVNTNTKEALFINKTTLQGLTLTLRALNENQLVYLSEVEDGECNTLTWEELGEPAIE